METFSLLDLFWCLVVTGAGTAEVLHRVARKRTHRSTRTGRAPRPHGQPAAARTVAS